MLRLGQTLPDTGWKVRDPNKVIVRTKPAMHKPLLANLATDEVHLTQRDVNRWKMAWCASSRTYCSPFIPAHRVWFRSRISDWPDLQELASRKIGLGFCAATFIYGGLHALAWAAQFQSPFQRLLWRTFSCKVMGALPAILALKYFIVYLDNSGEPIFIIPLTMFASLFVLIVLAYVLAHGYLVVECFI